ncbi:M48 family metallopeptidase [Aestuariirhabdus sp. Z084]|uniref:M48 family metallopeptidase n=1 Tax=Aestuariirhabdus haliotis TaxID=2918751 RepID=UPI00201B44FD|nr:M48 family metallopeptidase [Aestuariirhabdus haliotis]MCL6416645.1 M48 family metallopeptidase [Aestuariirhabdus haliotis]MCL6420680.1 M48 family metallopeptidase [Aestuariirhabdus haliotis]
MPEFTEEQFVELIKKSEVAAAENINSYKLKLALFALLGYAVIFFVVASLVLLVGGTIGLAFVGGGLFLLLIKKKFIFVILIAIWTLLKALWVKFDPPEGRVLERNQYPELFKEIDELTDTLNALKIHQVIIQDNLNAAVVQHPRFGILGGQKNTLFLGIQLLLALPPQEMRSVLAHEFGHLSGNHSRFSGWIYRVRMSWYRIMEAFEGSESFGASLMRRFFNWYAPKFAAYSFALARNNEYEADQVAAELTSPEVAAKALVNVHAQAPYIDREFWDAYFKQADKMPTPPIAPYEGLARFLKKSPITRKQLLQTIKQEMQEETHYADTHPALKDRVEAITSQAVIPSDFSKNSAEVWLGERYQDLLSEFDKDWMGRNSERWKGRYEYVVEAKRTLAETVHIDLDTLSDDDLWDLTQYKDEFEGDEAALPVYLRFLSRHPKSIGAAFYIGRILFTRKDERAIKYLRIALNGPNTLEDAGRMGYHLLKDNGKEQAAEAWWQEVLQVDERHREAAAQRQSFGPEEALRKADIDKELFHELAKALKANRRVGSAWIAEKAIKEDGWPPVYIVAFSPRGFLWSTEKAVETVAESLQIDADIFVVCVKGDTAELGKKVKTMGRKIV